MTQYPIISAIKGKAAGEDGIYIYFDDYDMPSEYTYFPGRTELFGNGICFIPRKDLYKEDILGNIDDDIPKKIIATPCKYLIDFDYFTGNCKILPVCSALGKRKEFKTNFRFC